MPSSSKSPSTEPNEAADGRPGKEQAESATAALRKEFQIRAGVLQQQIAALDKVDPEKTEKLTAKNQQSVELEVGAGRAGTAAGNRQRHEHQARAVRRRSRRPDSHPHDPEGHRHARPSTPRRGTRSSAWAASAAFALTCFGIAYLEFRNRRLDGPEQVDEGLGIRVVGTLPALSARKMLDPDHPVVAQLTESIDSVRTLLDARLDVEAPASRAGHQCHDAGRPDHRRQPTGGEPGPRRSPDAAGRRRRPSPRAARPVRRAAGRRLVRSAAGRSRRRRRDSSDPRRRPVAAHRRLLRRRRDPRPGDRADAAGLRKAPHANTTSSSSTGPRCSACPTP